MDQNRKTVQFYYQKSNLFRVVHADGAWGGVTPEGNLFFSFFNSRPPIPEMLVHPINDDGSLGEDIPELKVSKEGIIREVECGIVMTPQNVKGLIDFLTGRLEQLEKIRADASTRQESK
jgi:hypothetical protein